jgi:D-alanyl-lipoteichoic acid acyltransferase DltB (MBOAT superfamily)
MALNSFEFLLFFIVLFLIYYFPLKNNTRYQNVLLLLGSYFFYGYANIKLLPILIVTTVVFYYLGIALSRATNEKKSSVLNTVGVLFGVGILIYFKYLNFLINSFADLFKLFGLNSNLHTFSIIMPIGISFFTFRLISYIIEIHRGKIEPTKDFVAFATYVAFFPTILSGPIDRPNTFIPELHKKRHFDYGLAVDGCRQILWGLFKKLVLADNLAVFTEQAWGDIQGSSGSTLLIAAILYSFQIYTDFSGYSDIAIGIGKILGFRITRNFNYPFFATNVADFWRRWHISLTSWLTDYVFMPLNIKFRNWGNWGIICAIIINMIAVGMWHGANWTFAVFGLYNGLLFVPLILSGSFYKKKKQKVNKYGLPTIIDLTKMVGTFMLITIGLVIFRANNIEDAMNYIYRILSTSLISVPVFIDRSRVLTTVILLIIFILIEWVEQGKQYAIADLELKFNRTARWALYAFLIFLIGLCMRTVETPFIYFQF